MFLFFFFLSITFSYIIEETTENELTANPNNFERSNIEPQVYPKTEMTLFKDNSKQEFQENQIQTLLKNYQKSQNKKNEDYKMVSLLDNFYDGHRAVLQKMINYLNPEKNNDDMSRFNLKRPRPDNNFANSLKYMEEHYFNKKKKIKKNKGKKEDDGDYYYGNEEEYTFPNFPQNINNAHNIGNNPYIKQESIASRKNEHNNMK